MREENIKDVLGSGVKFHEELPRMKKEELVGVNFILRDGRVIDDWDGQFGTSEFALLKVELEDGKEYTTLCGGKAVVRQIKRLVNRHRLPGRIWCFLNLVTGENGDYYLLDWQPGSTETPPVQEETEKEQPEPVV